MEGDNKTVLKALAEIRRGQVLATKANPQTQDLYTNAFAHAILHSVCPIFEEDPELAKTVAERTELFPFHETYEQSHETVEEVAELLDKKWLAREKITFYDLEDIYGHGGKSWPGKCLRINLINITRYFYLRGMFDADFWKEFLSNCPTEASDVGDPWDRQEIVDWM